MSESRDRVCPVGCAKHLSNRLRRLVQSPVKICRPHVKSADTVIDVGCGPGFFSIPLASLVGPEGRIFAVDLQQGMLDLARSYADEKAVSERIQFHLCQSDSLDLNVKAEFVLLFYALHEIPDKQGLFKQLKHLVKPGGKVFVCEPPFHVKKSTLREYLDLASRAGFDPVPVKKVAFSKTILLQKR